MGSVGAKGPIGDPGPAGTLGEAGGLVSRDSLFLIMEETYFSSTYLPVRVKLDHKASMERQETEERRA